MKIMDYVNVFLSSLLGSILAIFVYSHFFKPKIYVVDIYKLSAVDGYPVESIFNSLEEKGYKGLILDKNMVIYAPESVDVTQEVEEYLNSKNQRGAR